MKNIPLIIITLLTSQFVHAKANYKIAEGKLHKGGSATVAVVDNAKAHTLKMSYRLQKKGLVPVPSHHLSGETLIDLPVQFKDERGYLELEQKKKMDVEGAKLVYLGRTVINKELDDAHKILVTLKNGKGKVEVIYHPQLPEAGWHKLSLTFISKIPLLDGYQVMGELVK